MEIRSEAGGTASSRFLPKNVLAQLVVTAARLTCVGLVAIGVSGAVAFGLGSAFGRSFVAGDPPGVTYSKARCADYFEYAPGSRTCEQAATAHHFGETVDYRLVAGVPGLLGLAGLLLIRRRAPAARGALPEGFEATIGATVFGAAALLLLGSSLAQIAGGQRAGAGSFLSGGIVALGPAGVYSLSLYRTLLRRSG